MKRKPLGELGEFKNGANFTSERMGRGVPLINVKDITNSHRIDVSSLDLVDLEPTDDLIAQEGDIFFVRSSVKLEGIGLASQLKVSEQPTIHCGFVIRFRPTAPEIYPEYLLYLLLSPEYRQRLKGLSAGAAIVNLSQTNLKSLEIPLPSLAIQQRIASILSAYDDLIENNRRRMTLLEKSARQLYREWFVRLRFPGYEHTRIVKGVPERWERTILENALVLQRGFDLTERDREDGNVPVFGSTGLNGFHSTVKVKGPGVVTGRSGTLGQVNYVEDDFWPHNTALWVKEFKKVSPLFAVFLLREMQLEQYNGGVSVPTLDRKVVHRVQTVIPPKKLVELFDGYVSPMFTQISNLRQQNKNLRTARDLLLPRLMSGEIAV